MGEVSSALGRSSCTLKGVSCPGTFGPLSPLLGISGTDGILGGLPVMVSSFCGGDLLLCRRLRLRTAPYMA